MTKPAEALCEVCGGETIKFRGKGLNLEYWLCPNKDKPGHLSKQECEQKFKQQRDAHGPRSGRFA